jgi:hypothetical protein
VRTPIGGTLALGDLLDGTPAYPAWQAGPLIDKELLAEVARIAVGTDIVAQRGAAHLHRHRQRCLDGARQPRAFLPGQRARLSPRTDARAEQGFAGVDVAHAHDQPRIHDQLLDGHLAPARDLPQVFAVEFVFEWFGRQAFQQRMRRRILREQQAAEAPRIVEAQRLSGVELDVHVIVRDARRRGRQHPQTARHAEVQDHRARVRLQQQVLGPAASAANRAANERGARLDVHRPSQSWLVDDEAIDAASHDMGFDAAAGGLDFGKFRHGWA